MLPYSHDTAAVKIPSKNPIDFVSRRRQQGLPMTMLDNAHFCIFLRIHVAINSRCYLTNDVLSAFTPSE